MAKAKTKVKKKTGIGGTNGDYPGLTLEEYRVKHDLTYDALALRCGAYDRAHIWRICKKQNRPDWPLAMQIVERLGGEVSLEKLVGK